MQTFEGNQPAVAVVAVAVEAVAVAVAVAASAAAEVLLQARDDGQFLL